VIFECQADVGRIGAVDEVDELSDIWCILIEVDGSGVEGAVGGDVNEVLDESTV
jgi:hypothetical protein